MIRKNFIKAISAICILSVGVFFMGCKKEDSKDEENVSKSIIMLKIDYLTYNFEGGQLIELAPYTNLTDTLPLIVNYIEPLNTGSLKISYKSSNTTGLVFDGSIVWMGLGSRTFPSLLVDASSFPVLTTPLNTIDSSEFHVVHYDLAPQQIYYDSIWGGIKHLKIVDEFRRVDSPKMSLFLYRPSVGAGDPADWDWYILLEK